MLMPSITNPANIIIPTSTSGNFGKPFSTNLKCGCASTNITQNTAKYNIYGVKIDNSIMIANKKQYIGRGLLSPWILDPSHKSSVGQNTSIISGVPLPAKNRNGVDNIIRHDAKSDTLLLNHRFSRSINKKPKSSPMMMLGSLIAYGDKPNITIENFCNNLYGKSTISPFNMPFLPR